MVGTGKMRLDEANEALLRGDFVMARDLFEILAATGSRAALLGLAAIYERGNADIPQDYAKSRYWYERALAEARSSVAALKLGHFYYHGFGVTSDFSKAFKYYSQLKNSNNPIALLRLGWLYETGRGVPQNLSKARELYHRGAKLGNIQARKNLGFFEMKHGNILLGVLLWMWTIIQGVPLAFINTDDKRLRTY